MSIFSCLRRQLLTLMQEIKHERMWDYQNVFLNFFDSQTTGVSDIGRLSQKPRSMSSLKS